jgi:regulatory protein
MTITGIEPQKRAKNRYSVFIDGEFAFGLGGVDLLYHKLEAGQEITADRLGRIIEETVFIKARDKAVSLLAFRQRSVKELTDRLSGDFGKEIIRRVTDWLSEQKYLDDGAFAENLAQNLRGRGYSERAVRAKLFEKGVGGEEIERADTSSELNSALTALGKRYRDGLDDEPDEKRRAFAYLARRGFSSDMCARAITTFLED